VQENNRVNCVDPRSWRLIAEALEVPAPGNTFEDEQLGTVATFVTRDFVFDSSRRAHGSATKLRFC
jgi:hypothetical protein